MDLAEGHVAALEHLDPGVLFIIWVQAEEPVYWNL